MKIKIVYDVDGLHKKILEIEDFETSETAFRSITDYSEVFDQWFLDEFSDYHSEERFKNLMNSLFYLLYASDITDWKNLEEKIKFELKIHDLFTDLAWDHSQIMKRNETQQRRCSEC